MKEGLKEFLNADTFNKKDIWIIATICLLSGIIIGMIFGGAKNGISFSFASNNASNNRNVCNDSLVDANAGEKNKADKKNNKRECCRK